MQKENMRMLSNTLNLCGKAFSNKSNSSKMFWNKFSKELRSSRKDSSLSSDEKNAIWFLYTLTRCTLMYIDTFRQLRRGDFRSAWGGLERVEIRLSQLKENLFLEDFFDHVRMLLRIVMQFQSTYPYKYFASPEMKIIDWKCSICGQKSTPIEPCGHQIGRVYSGEFCARIITNAKMIGMSIVTNPVQKYSVLLPPDARPDFSVTEFVVARLDGPFHDWEGEWTYVYHPHSRFADIPHSSKCPCGSNLKYNQCCLEKVGVLLDHFQVKFAGKLPPLVQIVRRGE